MKTPTLVAQATVSALLVGSLTACNDAYWNAAGPVYVVGTYTCTNPNSGQIDYCVEYSDGSSSLVPFWVYNSVGYGSVLSYTTSTHVWVTSRSSYYTGRRAPDVYHVTYHARTGGTTTVSAFGGMSYRNKSGRVIYRSAATGTSYHSVSSFHSSYHGH